MWHHHGDGHQVTRGHCDSHRQNNVVKVNGCYPARGAWRWSDKRQNNSVLETNTLYKMCQQLVPGGGPPSGLTFTSSHDALEPFHHHKPLSNIKRFELKCRSFVMTTACGAFCGMRMRKWGRTRISDIFKPSAGGEVLHTSVVSDLQ